MLYWKPVSGKTNTRIGMQSKYRIVNPYARYGSIELRLPVPN
jgi:hypothetical protein